jgi:probable F420-dependent oxidoreductase
MLIDAPLTADYPGLTTRVHELADAGVDGLFTLEANRDVFIPLALATATGRSVDLYPNVAIAFPRSPMHLAYQAWDLQRLSGGRFALGLGSQIRPHIEKRFSAKWHKPVAQLRELTAAIKAVFACWHEDAPLAFRGDYYTLTLMTPTFVPAAIDSPPPVWLGALGPRMTLAAAEVADGVLVHPFNTERYLRAVTMPAVDRGLAATGRARTDFSVGVDVILCLFGSESEQAAAEQACRANLAFYASTPAYRVTLDEHGWGDVQPELNRLSKQGRWAEMPALIDDDMLRTICVCGTPDVAAAQLRSLYGDIADRVALSMPAATSVSLLAELVERARTDRAREARRGR